MEKRYQVFVSSTFLDLQAERQEVIFTLMKMDCFPAGMELFPTADEEQWSFIKRAIDQSDYYVIIVGARYGSLASGELISYTEKEFDYAVSEGKTVLVLLHKDPESLPINKSDGDAKKTEALQKFRDKLQTGRLVDYWMSSSDLGGKVALGLIQAIKSKPALGWIRGNEYNDEASNLLKANVKLRDKIEDLQSQILSSDDNPSHKLAGLDDQVEIIFISKGAPSSLGLLGMRSSPLGLETGQEATQKKTVKFAEVFKVLGRLLERNNNTQNLQPSLSALLVKSLSVQPYYSLSDQSYETIILQFRALGLIELEVDLMSSSMQGATLSLTYEGESELLSLLAIKRIELK